MTPDQHYSEAEALIAEAHALSTGSAAYEHVANVLREAKVHAILSLRSTPKRKRHAPTDRAVPWDERDALRGDKAP